MIEHNQSFPDLRMQQACEVVVVGAGPAGSSCAHWLARAGCDVFLVDQYKFPRHKVCGDALIPDALAALQRLGLYDQVMAMAKAVDHVRCVAPSGSVADLKAPMAVISRYVFDDVLLQAAVAQGARFLPQMAFESLAHDADRGRAVRGAWFRAEGERILIKARHVVLATGASVAALDAAGLAHRRAPSAMALRTIIRHPFMREHIRGLQVIWHRMISPGYAWIFPLPEDTFNIGVGVFDVAKSWPEQKLNLRQVFDRLAEVHPLAAKLLHEGERIEPLKGAPLRSGLTGSEIWQDGLLVCGEAIGSTYGLTGEGIGKAMETGLMAAESILLSKCAQGLAASKAGPIYESKLAALRPRYAQYEKANRINRQFWLAEALIRWAARSSVLRNQASEVLNEQRSPEDLVTAGGLLRVWLKHYGLR